MKIIYDQYWHGGNRSKGLGQRDLITTEKAACDLCGCQDSQKHMILECDHAAMTTLREAAIDIIKGNITAGMSTSCALVRHGQNRCCLPGSMECATDRGHMDRTMEQEYD